MLVGASMILIAVVQVSGEQGALRVVDRYGGTVSRYSLSVTCGSSKWEVHVSSAVPAPALRKLRGCSGRIREVGFQSRTIELGEFERGVVALDSAKIGDPVVNPPPPLELRLVPPASGSRASYSGAWVRLLFKYGDEVYSAPLRAGAMSAVFPIAPAGTFAVVLQLSDRLVFVKEIDVTDVDRSLVLAIPVH